MDIVYHVTVTQQLNSQINLANENKIVYIHTTKCVRNFCLSIRAASEFILIFPVNM